MGIEPQSGDQNGGHMQDAAKPMETELSHHDIKDQEEEEEAAKKLETVSFFKLFSYADWYDWLLMVLGTIGAFCHGLSQPMFFLFFGHLLNSFGKNTNDPQKTADEVGKYSLNLVYLGIVMWGSAWAEVACWMHTGQRQASKMRKRYLEATLKQDIGFFDTDGQTGMLVDSISKDCVLVQDAISDKMGSFLQFIACFFGGFGVAFSSAWQLALVTLAAVPAIAFAGGLYAYTMTRLSSKSQEAYGEAATVAEQTMAQIRTVFSFVGEEKAEKSYSESLAVTLKLGYKGGLAKGLSFGVVFSIFSFSWALVFWYGGVLIRQHGKVDGGKAISAIFSVMVGGMALGQALSNVTAFSKGQAAAYNIFSMISKAPTMDHSNDTGLKLKEVKGNIELNNITFAYPSRPNVRIFEDFSLTIPSGKTVALVGGSGSGKSTVVSLIERLYDPVAGQVLLDGVDIRTLSLQWLREQIGLVNQEPALFATSLLENILYGKEGASMEEVEAAAKVANAHAFITELPDGYETQAGEHGVQLSGGQKQRVAIARAMLKNPKVLLLDEATSALDAASEKVVQDALDRVMIGRTTVIIAHRLSTIRGVDIIGVVQGGKIVEMGTHDELSKKGDLGAYSILVKLQEMALASDGTILGRTSKAINSFKRIGSAKGSQISKSGRISSDWRLSQRRVSSNFDKVEAEAEEEKEESHTKSKASFVRLVRLNAPEWPYALLGSIGAMLAGLVNPTFALVISELMKVYYEPDNDKMKKSVQKYALVYVGIGVVSIGIHFLQHYYFGIVGENLTARVREMMFKAIIQNEVGWFDLEENNSKQLAARLAVDATHVRATIGDRISLLLQNTTMFVTACVIGLVIEWQLALILLATFPLLLAATIGQHLCMKGFAGDLNKAHAHASMIAGDAIGNIRTVAAFSAENKVLVLFSNALSEPEKRSFLRGNISGFFLGLSQMCLYCSYALVLWYGSVLVKNGTSDFGSVMKVIMVLLITAFGVAETLSMTPDFIKGNDALVSVFEIVDRQTQIDSDDPNGEVVEGVQGDIELCDVEFAYPTRRDVTILKGLCLNVNAGESLAIVGSSGSGKSSIIALVERFYDPISGQVRIDGKDIRKLNLRSLRKHIGLVQQEPVLFAASIYDNILYGRQGAKQMEVEAAAQVANAHGFISSLPEGYQTHVGERGVQLSGGQKQRVAIARAVLKDPSILLLDEATSALDAESEKVVQVALDKIMKGRTTIVVAHRLTTIRNAHSIAVIQEGRILEQGSHHELIDKPGGSYAQFVNIQRARGGSK